MGSTVLTAPASRKAQGRSASGRNGGARKTTSSNNACHALSHRIAERSYISASKVDARIACQNAAVLQLFACGPVLYPLYWTARSQLESRSFSIHVRVSSHCTHTYRSRWGRATCLSNWAQGLNMKRLCAQAPWRSHTQTP